MAKKKSKTADRQPSNWIDLVALLAFILMVGLVYFIGGSLAVSAVVVAATALYIAWRSH